MQVQAGTPWVSASFAVRTDPRLSELLTGTVKGQRVPELWRQLLRLSHMGHGGNTKEQPEHAKRSLSVTFRLKANKDTRSGGTSTWALRKATYFFTVPKCSYSREAIISKLTSKWSNETLSYNLVCGIKKVNQADILRKSKSTPAGSVTETSIIILSHFIKMQRQCLLQMQMWVKRNSTVIKDSEWRKI